MFNNPSPPSSSPFLVGRRKGFSERSEALSIPILNSFEGWEIRVENFGGVLLNNCRQGNEQYGGIMTNIRKRIAGMLLIVGILLLAVCAPKTAPAPPPALPKVMPVAPAGQTFEGKWAETIAAARKEGKVMLTTTAGGNLRSAFSYDFFRRLGLL